MLQHTTWLPGMCYKPHLTDKIKQLSKPVLNASEGGKENNLNIQSSVKILCLLKNLKIWKCISLICRACYSTQWLMAITPLSAMPYTSLGQHMKYWPSSITQVWLVEYSTFYNLFLWLNLSSVLTSASVFLKHQAQ